MKRPQTKRTIERLKADWYLPQETLHRAFWNVLTARAVLEDGDFPQRLNAELDRAIEALNELLHYLPVLRYYAVRAAERETKAVDARRQEGEINRNRVIDAARLLTRSGTPKRELVGTINEQTGLSKTHIRNILKQKDLL